MTLCWRELDSNFQFRADRSRRFRQGGSIGWADPDSRLAVAMTHNRMFRATTPEENPLGPIGEAVRKALGVSG